MPDKRIKLLFIVNTLFFGGAEKHVITLLNHFDTSRFRLSLAYLKNEDTLLKQLNQEQVEGGVFCCHVRQKIGFAAARQLAQVIDRDQIDAVICTNSFALLHGWLACRIARRKAPLAEVFHSSELGSFKRKLQMAFYWPFFLHCDQLVYVCENQRQFWRARTLHAKRDAVIHNGIDIEYFTDHYSREQKQAARLEYGFSEDDYVIGLCAALRPEKCHGDILQALVQLRAQGIEAKALFIGEGVERPHIEQQIQQLSLQGKVKITGFISDVRPLVAACDVMTLTSHRVETFSIAALEAMALGKPMVMTDTGGASEMVSNGENGYLYQVGAIDALTAALTTLKQPEKRLQMGQRARQIIEQKFTMKLMVKRYQELFAALGQGAENGR